MTRRVSADAYAASDEFLAVIFADPDLFEDAFASVMSSWGNEPPAPPDTSAPTVARFPFEGRGQYGQAPKPIARGAPRGATAGQLLVARAPPRS